MGSKILPQALITIPSNPKQCALKKLGFCTSMSGRSSFFNRNNRISFSRASWSSVDYQLYHSYPVPMKRGFSVRAESNAEGEAEVTSNGEGNEEVGGEEEASVAVAEAEEVSESEAKLPRKPRVKLGDIMRILNERAVEAAENERPVPDLRTGDIVEIKLEVPENKRRLSVYKGIVMSRQNAGIHTTIRIRRIIAGVGVEIVFPLYSPNIKELKVLKHRKVRRARLYYLRDKLPRLSTFK